MIVDGLRRVRAERSQPALMESSANTIVSPDRRLAKRRKDVSDCLRQRSGRAHYTFEIAAYVFTISDSTVDRARVP